MKMNPGERWKYIGLEKRRHGHEYLFLSVEALQVYKKYLTYKVNALNLTTREVVSLSIDGNSPERDGDIVEWRKVDDA